MKESKRKPGTGQENQITEVTVAAAVVDYALQRGATVHPPSVTRKWGRAHRGRNIHLWERYVDGNCLRWRCCCNPSLSFGEIVNFVAMYDKCPKCRKLDEKAE